MNQTHSSFSSPCDENRLFMFSDVSIEALRDELKVSETEREPDIHGGSEDRERILGNPDEEGEETSVSSDNLAEIESVNERWEMEKIGGEKNLENLEIGEKRRIGYFPEEEKRDEIRGVSEKWAEIGAVKECLLRVIETIGGENNEEMRDEIEDLVEENGNFSVGVEKVYKLAITVKSKLNEYKKTKELEKSDTIMVSSENLLEIKSIKERLSRIYESIGEEKNCEIREGIETETELVEEIEDFSVGIREISKLMRAIESKVSEYKEVSEKENIDKVKAFSNNFQKIKSAKGSLVRLLESISEENKTESIVDRHEETNEEIEPEFGEEFKAFSVQTNAISNLVVRMESKLGEYRETREKEKRELESSVVSLTEENRDINTLFRVTLAEKEAVERSFNRLKGNSETKRGAIWGLPRVGFGFMMGMSEQTSDNSSIKSDSSECEEEVESLAFTVEKMMKNLRLEITKLRKSLEESRSDTERLQSLTQKQAQTISENALYIKEMEDREEMLAHNVEELLREIKESEEEVARWREACELEVEAGKSIVEDRDKLVQILKQELEKTKAALEIANGKLKLKEDLANAAMAAQAAGERSLQLTDSRVAMLNARVEELTKQLEEAENKDNIRRKVRYICWPFRALKVNSGGVRNFKRMLPEMHALLN